jgi:hypothetical protein
MVERMAFEFIIASLIGAVVFAIIGYFAQADGGLSFSYWIGTPKPGPWALVGGFIGFGLRFLRR